MGNYLTRCFGMLGFLQKKKRDVDTIEKTKPKKINSIPVPKTIIPKQTLPKKRSTIETLKKTGKLHEVNEVVVISYEDKKDIGVIESVEFMNDWRNNEMTWGYSINFIGNGDKIFPFPRIPERYLEKFFKHNLKK